MKLMASSPVEKLLYITLLLLFIINIFSIALLVRQGYQTQQAVQNAKIAADTAKDTIDITNLNRKAQIAQIQKGQDFLLCALTAIAKGQQVNQTDIDACLSTNEGDN